MLELGLYLAKTTSITQHVGFTIYGQFLDGLNHMQFEEHGEHGSGELERPRPCRSWGFEQPVQRPARY